MLLFLCRSQHLTILIDFDAALRQEIAALREETAQQVKAIQWLLDRQEETVCSPPILFPTLGSLIFLILFLLIE